MNGKNPFHAGERAVQQRAGESTIAERNGVMLKDTVISAARPFIAQQFMAVLASVDAQGQVWASLVFGKPGFVHTENGSAILIDVPEQERDPADPLWSNLAANPQLGMLFIELGSRRRYRVNGALRHLDPRGAEVLVQEAFPNCPKYIQRRHLRQWGEAAPAVQAEHGTLLRGSVEDIVRQADTVFVASRHAASGADASHRGGHAGFVQIIDDSTLRLPDYDGNGLFNTLGNFTLDAHAGLCIPDFARGQLLQLTGSARLLWDQDDPDDATGGTGRYWEFKVARWILRATPQPLAWDYLDASPFNPAVSP